MRIKTKRNDHLEGSICELFAYTYHSGTYSKSSDMNELSEIAGSRNQEGER